MRILENIKQTFFMPWVLNITGREYPPLQNGFEQDAEKMAQDMCRIGQDMHKAYQESQYGQPCYTR